MEKTIEVNDFNFEDTIKEGIVLIDFWAEWCGPCKMIAPFLKQIAEETNFTIGKYSVENNSVYAKQFGIRTIPTLLVFKNGTLVDSINGAVPKQKIIDTLNKHL
jgi:thioredoxin 1